MDTRNWIIAAVAAVIIVIVAFSFWPTGEEPTATPEEPAAEEPGEPEAGD